MGHYVVIAGLSGAGRSQAAKDFEDLGWFVIDNLPPALMAKVSELAEAPGSAIERVVFVAGSGHASGGPGGPSRFDADPLAAITEFRNTVGTIRLLFLDCSTRELVRRYEQTRRRHPLSNGGSLEGAIEAERRLLAPVRAAADIVVDTTDLNIHQLRQQIRSAFGQPDSDVGMQTVIRSFGFKHGLPLDADLVFDVRFLPNPHWKENLRPLSGLDDDVRDYVFSHDDAVAFLDQLVAMFELLLPAYRAEGKAYLNVAIGCTGGRHRSVAMADALGSRLSELGTAASVTHRDIEQ